MRITNTGQMPVALLLCAALFANFLLVAGHDAQRVFEIVTLLGCGAWLATLRPAVAGNLFAGPAGKALVLFFMFGLLASAPAREPLLAYFEVAVFFLLYLAAAGAGAEIAVRGLPAIVRLLQVVAVAGALYAFKFLVAYFGSFHLGIPLALDDFTPGFSNIRFFNHAQTATLPLLVLLCCVTAHASRLRWLWLAVTAYWWLALFGTSARGTLLGMAVACVAVGCLLRRAAAPYLKQVLFSAMLGLLAYLVLLVAVPALLGMEGLNAFTYSLERTAADPASGRLKLWWRAVELIAAHPVLGVGPMHFAHYGRSVHVGAHPHDWLLQIASEWGIPALACLLVAIGIGLRALLRAARRVDANDDDNRAAAAALLVAAIALLVDGMVSGILVMPQSQLAIALYLACAIGWYRSRMPSPALSGTRLLIRMSGVVLVAASMAGTAVLLPDGLARLHGELSPELQAVNTGGDWPRLWKAGHF